MSDIEELNGRIMAAMERMSKGLETFKATDPGEIDALKQALAEEKQVSAQHEERLRRLSEREAAAEARARTATERVEKLDLEMQQYRDAHIQLTAACEALRSANAEGVGDPEAINAALAAELDALRAMRKSERAEADEILAGLMPLLEAAEKAQPAEEAG